MLKRLFHEPVTIYRYDRFLTGFIPGMLAPWVGVVAFYIAQFNYMPFMNFLKFVFHPLIFSPIMSLGVVVNLFVFFVFIYRHYYISARAVILASILYAIPIVIVKLF